MSSMSRLRDWLSRKLQKGFWFPYATKALKFLYEKLSLGYRFKVWLRSGSENPRGASELYQVFWILVVLVWISLIWRQNEVLSDAWALRIGIAIAVYRLADIMLFALHWIFVAETEKLHSIRRSLAGFILNIVEISLCTSVVVILTNCQIQTESQWDIVYNHLSAAFGLSIPATGQAACCRVVAHAQLIVSAVLLAIAVASLVGGVLRGEKHKSAENHRTKHRSRVYTLYKRLRRR